VCANIDETTEFALGIARDDDGLSTDPSGYKIARFGYLALVAHIDPVAFKNMFHFQFIEFMVCEHRARHTELAASMPYHLSDAI
jgi:hypothetical protein